MIEILSSPTHAKQNAPLAVNGAQLAWMIDPYAATVSIIRPGTEVEFCIVPMLKLWICKCPGDSPFPRSAV